MRYSTFDSEELSLFTAVLDQVCVDLRIIDEDYRASIGKRIMFKAQTGERRFQVLVDYACQGGLFDRFGPAGKRSGYIMLPYRFSMIDPAADPNPSKQ